GAPDRARVHGLLPQPLQPGSDLAARRGPHRRRHPPRALARRPGRPARPDDREPEPDFDPDPDPRRDGVVAALAAPARCAARELLPGSSGAASVHRRRLHHAGRAAHDRDERNLRRTAHLVGADERRMLERTHEDLASDVAIIASEFLGGFQKVLEIDRPAVSIFGSSRVAPGSGPYEQARATAKLFAEAQFAVVTGGGPGVMEGANRGCKEGGGLSVGFNITLPHEQGINPYCDLSMTFKHFYARKTMFVK